MTHLEFFEAFEKGQRKFSNLDFEDLEGFSNKEFSGVEFENCFLWLDFKNSDLSNSKFIGCNLKCIDLRQTNLTNALMKNCLVESAMFDDTIINGFQFIDNYYFGITLGQKDLEKLIHIHKRLIKKGMNEKNGIFALNARIYNFLIKYKVSSSNSNDMNNTFFDVKMEEIELSEEKLGYKLPKELKEFYQEIGYGFFHRNSGSFNRLLSPLQVSQINLREDFYETDPDLDIFDELYNKEKLLFFEINEGIYLAIDKKEENKKNAVWLFDKKISNSLENFIVEFANNPKLIDNFHN